MREVMGRWAGEREGRPQSHLRAQRKRRAPGSQGGRGQEVALLFLLSHRAK